MASTRQEFTFVRGMDVARPASLVTLVLEWDARFRARRALAAMPPERCVDLGLSAAQIAAETAKPFWRP